MEKINNLMDKLLEDRKKIEKFFYFNFLPKIIYKKFREAKHSKEWIKELFNYNRMIEIPLTLYLLNLKKTDLILDISSPKLLSLYLSTKGFNLTISDVTDYFINDFKIYSRFFNISPKLDTFDAKKTPYLDNSFDKIFSISVLEHVPDYGDIEIVKEGYRILKKGGQFIITLPAYKTYMEEWVTMNISWPTKKNEKGESFFQRRYNKRVILERFANTGFKIEDIVFIAEKPIKLPKKNSNGVLLHNVYYLRNLNLIKFFKRIKMHFLAYYALKRFSKKTHYLTRDESDLNVRQVLVRFVKE